MQGEVILSSLFLLGVWWRRLVLVVTLPVAGGGGGSGSGGGVRRAEGVVGCFLGNWLGSLKQA